MLRNTRDRVSSFARKTCHHSIGMIDRIIFATVLLPLLVASLADWQGSFRRSSISISFAWSGLDNWLVTGQLTGDDERSLNAQYKLRIGDYCRVLSAPLQNTSTGPAETDKYDNLDGHHVCHSAESRASSWSRGREDSLVAQTNKKTGPMTGRMAKLIN